jgi:short subunit fatty acids transporter
VSNWGLAVVFRVVFVKEVGVDHWGLSCCLMRVLISKIG